jgi:hypothetical protein
VVASNCPHCRYRETYFIDRWDDRKGSVLMKSFERRHTEEKKDISAFLWWRRRNCPAVYYVVAEGPFAPRVGKIGRALSERDSDKELVGRAAGEAAAQE